MTALGIRLNNPGNIRKGNKPWYGQVWPGDHNDFCTFETMVLGVRALAYNLIEYQVVHKLNTLDEIVGRWAPPSENPTESYIHNMCDWTGFVEDAPLDLTKEPDLEAVVRGIIMEEQGQDYRLVADSDITKGIDAARRALHLV